MGTDEKARRSRDAVEAAPDERREKKAYRPPGVSIYGRIERTTGGGSGMAKESFAMETFRFP